MRTMTDMFGCSVEVTDKEAIIAAVMHGCSCTEQKAHEYLDGEVDNLRSYTDNDDLRIGDFYTACHNLGIDTDYVTYFINQLAMY